VIDTREKELLVVDDMVDILKDWLGGCPNHPGNTDVIEVLLRLGVTPQEIAAKGLALSVGEWTRRRAAALILDLTGTRRVSAALARHGKVYHGLRLDVARRDVRELHAEARELVQREILLEVGHAR
jgi:hypothetical protein